MSEKTLEIVKPSPDSPALKALKDSADQLTAETAYHKGSIDRINEVRGFLHAGTYKGEEAIRLSGCLQWLKGVKTNIKGVLEQAQARLNTAVDAIKEEAKNGDKNKK